MKPNNSIVWLSSYPKSGNTWVRFLITNLILGSQDSTANMERLIPDIHKTNLNIAQEKNRMTIVKSHFMFSAKMPHAEKTAACVYVVRNPLSVAVSSFHYHLLLAGLSLSDEELSDERKRYIREFIDNHGDPDFRTWGFGTWDEHVKSWLDNKQSVPYVLVRYEDLSTDPCLQLTRISKFLNLGKSLKEIQRAVDDSRYERMLAIEEKELSENQAGFFTRERQHSGIGGTNRFMRAGSSQTASAELTDSQIRELLSVFSPVMRKLGYD